MGCSHCGRIIDNAAVIRRRQRDALRAERVIRRPYFGLRATGRCHAHAVIEVARKCTRWRRVQRLQAFLDIGFPQGFGITQVARLAFSVMRSPGTLTVMAPPRSRSIVPLMPSALQ